MKAQFKAIIIFLALNIFCLNGFSQLCNTNIVVFPPVNPSINVALSSPESFYVTVSLKTNTTFAQSSNFRFYGNIESFPAGKISVRYDSAFSLYNSILVNPGAVVQLTPVQLLRAFDFFNPNTLQVSGMDASSLFKGKNFRLPDGRYKFYIVAKSLLNMSYPTVDTSNFVYFNICSKVKAPQFTQLFGKKKSKKNQDLPIVGVTSPIIFNWTTPTSSCGGRVGLMNYEFEIRQMFEGQNITDVLNNPLLFKREMLTTPNFIMDTTLYQGILKKGNKYVIRVKAYPTEDIGINIDNDGYSRPEAFIYGETEEKTVEKPEDKKQEKKD